MSPDSIAQSLARIEDRIAAAARRAGRAREEITLVGVSKTHPASAIHEAYDAGVRHFGENRVQEWLGKSAALLSLPGANWHLIGHLQSNKAGRAALAFDCVDSADDLAVVQRLQRVLEENAAPGPGSAAKLRVLIEVRVAEEETKSGVAIAALPALAEGIAMLDKLELVGLMCIPPFLENAEEVRPYFRKLRAVRDDLATRLQKPLPVLSMGMSHDFSIAIEEGATEVRVGTALFGTRAAVEK
jgi:pyridoxal phosphate enzyme (YggS family)